MTNSWGSHNRRSHSALKSVPKMAQDNRVVVTFNDENYTLHTGYNSVARRVIKKMHKKKRRQLFKQRDQTEL